MADGGWHNGLAEPLARERFQDVLSDFAQRLAAAEPMRRETAVALVQQLERLGRRMAREQEIVEGRAAELDLALGALTARLEAEAAAGAAREAELAARVNELTVELAKARAAKRPLLNAKAVRTILAAAAACAALCGAGAGVVALTRHPATKDPVVVPPAVEASESASPESAPIEPATPVEAATSAPAPTASVVAPAAHPVAPEVKESYATVAQALSHGDASAVARLTALAEAGNVRAQRHLAQLYDAGASGVTRDPAAARRWTLRAAEGGDRLAMFNTAQFMMDGEGGSQDLAGAATWFRRAADRGVVDAQFNLGLMYEAGRGVERSPREALRWYARAGKAGDAGARQKQADLERQLKEAETPSVSPTAKAETPTSSASPDAGVRGASVSDTQAFLAQQGYYIGPIDGVVSQDLRVAADAYLRDHPIARTR